MPVVYGESRPRYHTAPGSVRQFLVSASTGATAVSIIPSEWQPGAGPTTPHRHAHEEVFVFLAGTGEGEVGDERVSIRPGMAVIVPPNTTHWFRNTGSVPMRQLVVLASPEYTGPDGQCPAADDPRALVCLPAETAR
jgi:mannose-6-phosphate isomerase-like protein (cupin superfamily)